MRLLSLRDGSLGPHITSLLALCSSLPDSNMLKTNTCLHHYLLVRILGTEME